jgi:hypothetical protein
MIPTIVARKIASSCHAFRDTPAGTGTNQRMTPVAMEAIRGFIAAPCHGCVGGGAAAPEVAAALTITTGDRGFGDKLGRMGRNRAASAEIEELDLRKRGRGDAALRLEEVNRETEERDLIGLKPRAHEEVSAMDAISQQSLLLPL